MNYRNDEKTEERLQWYKKERAKSSILFLAFLALYLLAGWVLPFFLGINYFIGVFALHVATIMIALGVVKTLEYANEVVENDDWLRDIARKLAEDKENEDD